MCKLSPLGLVSDYSNFIANALELTSQVLHWAINVHVLACILTEYWMSFTPQESNNLKNRNSYRYNGLVRRQTVGLEPATDGKGVVLVTRNRRSKTGGFWIH